MSASHPTDDRSATPLADHLLAWFDRVEGVTHQARTWQRLVLLTIGYLLTLGRHTTAQLLVTLTAGQGDWTAWYRLFSQRRIEPAAMARVVLRAWLALYPAAAPCVVAVDATQLPRSSRRMPGVGFTLALRTPPWKRGIHLAQRLAIVSGLVPRSASGDSRCVPLRSRCLRSAKTVPIGDVPEQTEAVAAAALVSMVRTELDTVGEADRPLLVLGDAAYATRPFLTGLPARCWVLVRCAKNRALFGLPPAPAPGQRGRPRLYGTRWATPAALVHVGRTDPVVAVPVRGATLSLRVKVLGPCLVRGLPHQPLMLLLVPGRRVARRTTTHWYPPHFFLVTAVPTASGSWGLPLPLVDLLAWAWQRWEVEVMHRELKSRFGLGEQQQWSRDGAALVLAWVLCVYALLILTACHCWGTGPPPVTSGGRWYTPRRWSVEHAAQALRAELWQLGEVSPVWARNPDEWAEMTRWLTTATNAVRGQRRI
jgi:hypothetical protein